ncbi:replication-relaxation family protein (plasmid) [Streptomyces sp. NBC_00053]|uniref:replication-relaxation family protein n=1 Tax=unclassified Streptomyces TaxID=2593676 RepID=UPI002255E03B|nr:MULTISPECIES: replication-relaxation family protein [unclassified Streptomyces]MCX4399923.1 replication-relaxation family protein [Streptomyces sp. NBC_01767]MCX4852126.1 replication-relaxation family protein [Streptomyces sp. NBC_00893]MCX5506072.1 replication-relaxation family protein [Streptomyces sp. NBC_00052]MCX5554272.1 replication-relaxation family protein [Streptomyces sp. NBC_00051]WSP52976.1 replication-relaxation family protein [Streptomyces sp. NBC_01243]
MRTNHAIKQTGLSFNTDAVLAVPTKTSEVRLFELDNGSMSRARLAKEVWDYERYAGHRVWEGARGTIGGTSRSGSATATPAPRPSRGCTSS